MFIYTQVQDQPRWSSGKITIFCEVYIFIGLQKKEIKF